MKTCEDTSKNGAQLCIFILFLVLIGVLGLFLNSLVIIAVRKNKKLSTSINDLLVWICVFSIVEVILGISSKIIILGSYCSTTGNVSWAWLPTIM